MPKRTGSSTKQMSSGEAIVVCTTGMDHTAGKLIARLSRLDGSVTSGDAHEATHCICGNPCRRTLKLFFALARGAWVLSPEWLTESIRTGRVLPPEPYECADDIP